jgi:hypothetical protein
MTLTTNANMHPQIWVQYIHFEFVISGHLMWHDQKEWPYTYNLTPVSGYSTTLSTVFHFLAYIYICVAAILMGKT